MRWIHGVVGHDAKIVPLRPISVSKGFRGRATIV